MYAVLRQQQPGAWVPLLFTFAGFLLIIADLLVINLVFNAEIPPSLLPVFQAVQVIVSLCFLVGALLQLRRLQPWWVRVLPAIGFVGAYIAVIAMSLLPIPHDPTLFQAATTLGVISFGVLALSVPVGVVAQARYARRVRSDGSPSRAT
jgi:hypothetical protein